MEEDIKILENILKTKEYGLCEITDTFYKAIENLLKGYKEQEKTLQRKMSNNKRLANKYLKLRRTSIPKSKVKEKIEELKELLTDYGEYNKLSLLEKVNVNLIDAKIEVLQEVLEEV